MPTATKMDCARARHLLAHTDEHVSRSEVVPLVQHVSSDCAACKAALTDLLLHNLGNLALALVFARRNGGDPDMALNELHLLGNALGQTLATPPAAAHAPGV